VAARNAAIRETLNGRYPAVRGVFCVDNKHYDRPANEEDVLLSRIVDLRRFCYAMPADSLYVSARNFLNNSLPALVRSLDSWYEAGTRTEDRPLLDQVTTSDLRQVRHC
jgi:hypothetical protein